MFVGGEASTTNCHSCWDVNYIQACQACSVDVLYGYTIDECTTILASIEMDPLDKNISLDWESFKSSPVMARNSLKSLHL